MCAVLVWCAAVATVAAAAAEWETMSTAQLLSERRVYVQCRALEEEEEAVDDRVRTVRVAREDHPHTVHRLDLRSAYPTSDWQHLNVTYRRERNNETRSSEVLRIPARRLLGVTLLDFQTVVSCAPVFTREDLEVPPTALSPLEELRRSFEQRGRDETVAPGYYTHAWLVNLLYVMQLCLTFAALCYLVSA